MFAAFHAAGPPQASLAPAHVAGVMLNRENEKMGRIKGPIIVTAAFVTGAIALIVNIDQLRYNVPKNHLQFKGTSDEPLGFTGDKDECMNTCLHNFRCDGWNFKATDEGGQIQHCWLFYDIDTGNPESNVARQNRGGTIRWKFFQ